MVASNNVFGLSSPNSSMYGGVLAVANSSCVDGEVPTVASYVHCGITETPAVEETQRRPAKWHVAIDITCGSINEDSIVVSRKREVEKRFST